MGKVIEKVRAQRELVIKNITRQAMHEAYCRHRDAEIAAEKAAAVPFVLVPVRAAPIKRWWQF